MLTALANKAKMALWVAKIERIVAKPPGANDGFSSESLATDATLTFSRSTTWGIVCDEMLDTQHSRVHFDRPAPEWITVPFLMAAIAVVFWPYHQ